MTIQAAQIELRDGSTISATSLSENLIELLSQNPEADKSGRIVIQASDALRLSNDSSITVETTQANAGDIILNAGFLVHLRDKGKMTTSVARGTGDGGNITIDPVFVVLDGASEIIANAQQGRGGNIQIRITGGSAFFESPDSRVAASSEFGVDGSVEIDAPDTDVSGSISTLPASFLDASALLSERCGARAAEEFSSFVVIGRGGVPPAPDGLLPSSYWNGKVPGWQEANTPGIGNKLMSTGLQSTKAQALAMLDLGCKR